MDVNNIQVENIHQNTNNSSNQILQNVPTSSNSMNITKREVIKSNKCLAKEKLKSELKNSLINYSESSNTSQSSPSVNSDEFSDGSLSDLDVNEKEAEKCKTFDDVYKLMEAKRIKKENNNGNNNINENNKKKENKENKDNNKNKDNNNGNNKIKENNNGNEIIINIDKSGDKTKCDISNNSFKIDSGCSIENQKIITNKQDPIPAIFN